MLDYNDLNDDEKRVLRDALGMERIYPFYLEDHNILLMDSKELFEYVYIYDIKKINDAVNFIEKIATKMITEKDINKSIKQKILEEEERIIKLSEKNYAYREN